jgi:hypothetical protein
MNKIFILRQTRMEVLQPSAIIQNLWNFKLTITQKRSVQNEKWFKLPVFKYVCRLCNHSSYVLIICISAMNKNVLLFLKTTYLLCYVISCYVIIGTSGGLGLSGMWMFCLLSTRA